MKGTYFKILMALCAGTQLQAMDDQIQRTNIAPQEMMLLEAKASHADAESTQEFTLNKNQALLSLTIKNVCEYTSANDDADVSIPLRYATRQ